MSDIPTNSVASNGVGVVSDEQLNSYLQVGGVVADLRAFGNALTGMSCFLQGYTTVGDGGAGLFVWDPSAIATDDNGVTTIQPYGVVTGRWLRDDPLGTSAQEWNAGTVDVLGANLVITTNDGTATLSATGTIGVGTVVAGTGLSGGGSATSVTINLGTIGAGEISGNPQTIGAVVQGITVGSGLSLTAPPNPTLSSSSGQWSAGTVNSLALGLTISGTTLTPPSSALGIGTYITASYHVGATPVIGTTYAGSTLYNAATDSSLSASGTWRCMGPITAYSNACCDIVYSTASFLRIA